MTREEEIQEAAKIFHASSDDYTIYKKGFEVGAEWADQHPREGLWDGDKVIAWLKENIDEYYMTGEFEEYFDSMYEDLKEAMED